jgi:hypothetical protein
VLAGNYAQIRFMVSNAPAKNGDDIVILEMPSGSQTRLKVHFEDTLRLVVSSCVNMTTDVRADNHRYPQRETDPIDACHNHLILFYQISPVQVMFVICSTT